MKTLVLGDLHHHVGHTDLILAAEEPWGRAVFLGDFFDDFGDGPAQARATARWLERRLADPRCVFLLGNHDLPYAFPQNASLWCPGYSRPKQEAVADVLSRAHWERFKLCHREGPWLLSHAGFHPSVCPWLGPGGEKSVERAAVAALDVLRASLAWPARGRPLPALLAWGRDRGGDAAVSGCTWLDWSRLVPVAGVHQIVGHTPDGQRPLRTRHAPRGSSYNFCLDHRNGRTYAAISPDGTATFRELLSEGRTVVLDQACPPPVDRAAVAPAPTLSDNPPTEEVDDSAEWEIWLDRNRHRGPMTPTAVLFVVMGDVHAHLALAAAALERIEAEQGRPVAQVFSVGDLGLFVEEADWRWLTGPKKHRHPEWSPAIAQAWEAWRWPLSVIAGNHEPFGPLRAWQPGHFGGRLTYTNAGELAHTLPGLRVYGLSGIHHPDHLGFHAPEEARRPDRPRDWPSLVVAVEASRASSKRLCYYKRGELDALRSLPARPHLLLTHDWPTWPHGVEAPSPAHADKPEATLLDKLRPEYHLCGHHHRPANFSVDKTEVRALNIIAREEHPGAGAWSHAVNPGWAALFEWAAPAAGGEDGRLVDLGFWPPLPGSAPSCSHP